MSSICVRDGRWKGETKLSSGCFLSVIVNPDNYLKMAMLARRASYTGRGQPSHRTRPMKRQPIAQNAHSYIHVFSFKIIKKVSA
jgi:hypothetical protein